MSEPLMHRRLEWLDLARGFGVILVVLGHVLSGLMRAGQFPAGPLGEWTEYALYTFHMPLFFFLTGLNVPHSLQRGATSFLAAKTWTIAYPYVLWSLLQGGLIMAMGHDVNLPLSRADLAAIWYRPIGQFWFLYALMLCHLAVVLVPRRRLLAGLSVLGLLVFCAGTMRTGVPQTLHDLPFYVAGLYAHGLTRRPIRSAAAGWSVVVLLWCGFALAVALGGPASRFDALGFASLPACGLGIAATLLTCRLLDGHLRWLATVGGLSMTIYVLHILAGSGIRMVMLRLHAPHNPWLFLGVGVGAGVTLPMLAHAVLARLRLLPALGLAPLPRSTRRAPLAEPPRFGAAP